MEAGKQASKQADVTQSLRTSLRSAICFDNELACSLAGWLGYLQAATTQQRQPLRRRRQRRQQRVGDAYAGREEPSVYLFVVNNCF